MSFLQGGEEQVEEGEELSGSLGTAGRAGLVVTHPNGTVMTWPPGGAEGRRQEVRDTHDKGGENHLKTIVLLSKGCTWQHQGLKLCTETAGDRVLRDSG